METAHRLNYLLPCQRCNKYDVGRFNKYPLPEIRTNRYRSGDCIIGSNYPLCGIFDFTWHRHQLIWKGPTAFSVSSENTSTEGNRKGKKRAGSISSEDRDTVIESEVEHGTEGEDNSRQLKIRSGTQFLATHGYKKNPDGPVANELDVNEGDTVVYLMKNDDNEHWWLVEDGKGQVGYVPVAYVMIIIDETLQEEESDTTRKEGHEKTTDGTNI